MFLQSFSPFNGKPISDLWKLEASKNTIKSFEPMPESRPYLQEDFFCWLAGYADRDIKKGERIYVKPSDARRLYDLFKREFK